MRRARVGHLGSPAAHLQTPVEVLLEQLGQLLPAHCCRDTDLLHERPQRHLGRLADPVIPPLGRVKGEPRVVAKGGAERRRQQPRPRGRALLQQGGTRGSGAKPEQSQDPARSRA